MIKPEKARDPGVAAVAWGGITIGLRYFHRDTPTALFTRMPGRRYAGMSRAVYGRRAMIGPCCFCGGNRSQPVFVQQPSDSENTGTFCLDCGTSSVLGWNRGFPLDSATQDLCDRFVYEALAMESWEHGAKLMSFDWMQWFFGRMRGTATVAEYVQEWDRWRRSR